MFGLALADALAAQGHYYILIEAHDQFVGQIKTEYDCRICFDIEPAWFWQGQLRIVVLIDLLGLKKFMQFYMGI